MNIHHPMELRRVFTRHHCHRSLKRCNYVIHNTQKLGCGSAHCRTCNIPISNAYLITSLVLTIPWWHRHVFELNIKWCIYAIEMNGVVHSTCNYKYNAKYYFLSLLSTQQKGVSYNLFVLLLNKYMHFIGRVQQIERFALHWFKYHFSELWLDVHLWFFCAFVRINSSLNVALATQICWTHPLSLIHVTPRHRAATNKLPWCKWRDNTLLKT